MKQVAQEGNNRSPEEVSSRYKYNSKLQETFGGTVETTGNGNEIKTGFCIIKMPYKEIFWHSMALKCEATFGGTVETTGTESITKTPREFFFGTEWHLTAKPAVRSN